MTNLRAELAAFVHEWRRDVPEAWRPVLEGVEPDLAAVPEHLTLDPGEVIFPLRKGHANPLAPVGSHPFRALDGLTPDAVRAVLLGQDPYPNLRQATGRSFEQGDLKNWQGKPTRSLRRMVQTLVQYRHPASDYVPNDSAWPALYERLGIEPQLLEAPSALVDRWQGAGVLCLNTSLTLSRFDPKKTPQDDRVQPAHMALWKPVVRAILQHLARRPHLPHLPLVLLLWGDPAQKAYKAMGVEAAAQAAGNACRAVKRDHPAYVPTEGDTGAAPFLKLPDPYTQANEALVQVGLPVIDW